MKTLVTGAAGFIAFHLIEKLLRSGVPVIGIDNFDPFYSLDLKRKNIIDLKAIAKETKTFFEFREMDIRDLSGKSFENEKIDAVIHLAAKAGVRPSLVSPEAYAQVNFNGTIRVIEFCNFRKIRNLVFGSSSSVYGNNTPVPFREDADCDAPVSPYAATKRAAELYCRTAASLYGISVAVLRFFTVYGPRQRPDLAIHKFTDLIYHCNTIPFYGDGTTSRDYTHVSDIVAGVVSAIEWTKRSKAGTYDVFNLGGSNPISLSDLVRILEARVGNKARFDRLPMQPGDVNRTYADVSKSRKVLGYNPKVSIEDGLADFVEWFLSAQPAPRKVAI